MKNYISRSLQFYLVFLCVSLPAKAFAEQCWFNFTLPENAYWYAGGRGCIWLCSDGYEKDEDKSVCIALPESERKLNTEVMESLMEQNR